MVTKKKKHDHDKEGRTIGLRVDAELSAAIAQHAERLRESESTAIRQILREMLLSSPAKS